HPDALRVAASDADGTSITVATNRGVRVIDLKTGRERSAFAEEHDFKLASFSADGWWLAALHEGGAVHVWDVTRRTELLFGGECRREITSLAFAPDGRNLVAGSKDNVVRSWDPAAGKMVRRLSDGYAVALSPDGRLFAAASLQALQAGSMPGGGIAH